MRRAARRRRWTERRRFCRVYELFCAPCWRESAPPCVVDKTLIMSEGVSTLAVVRKVEERRKASNELIYEGSNESNELLAVRLKASNE